MPPASLDRLPLASVQTFLGETRVEFVSFTQLQDAGKAIMHTAHRLRSMEVVTAVFIRQRPRASVWV